MAGKATKVGLECPGASLSAAHRLGSGSGVFQVPCCWDVVQRIKYSNTNDLLYMGSVQEQAEGWGFPGWQVSPQPCHGVVAAVKWHLEEHPKEHSLIMK